MALSFNGMVGGVTLGLFSLGMFFPWANARGAKLGATVGLALVLWVGLGAQIASMNGQIHIKSKPVSIAGCPCVNRTASYSEEDEDMEDEVFALYRVRPRLIL